MLSGALFQTEKTNARVTDVDGTTQNVGETRARGVELSAAGQITEKWGVSAGYTYQSVKYVDNGYSLVNGNYVPSYLNGKQLTKIPKSMFSVWTTYDVTDQLTLGGGASYIGERVQTYINPTSSTSTKSVLPETWRVDLMAAYKLTEATNVQLNVNNIFDKQIYSDSHVSQHVIVEPGRNFTVTLNHRF